MKIHFLLFTVLVTFAWSVSTLAAQEKSCQEILDELAVKHAGEFDSVVKKFRAQAVDGDNPARAFYILGIAHDIKGYSDDARRYYERSIRLQPENNPAHKFLAHLNRSQGRNAAKPSVLNASAPQTSSDPGTMPSSAPTVPGEDEKTSPLVVANAIRGVSPKDLASNFFRYKGKMVVLNGWIIDSPAEKRGKTSLLCSVNAATKRGRTSLDGYFLVQTSAKLPDDRRIAKGAKIGVRGIVIDRDFLAHPVTRETSSSRQVIIDPAGLRIVNEGVQTGPLTVRLK